MKMRSAPPALARRGDLFYGIIVSRRAPACQPRKGGKIQKNARRLPRKKRACARDFRIVFFAPFVRGRARCACPTRQPRRPTPPAEPASSPRRPTPPAYPAGLPRQPTPPAYPAESAPWRGRAKRIELTAIFFSRRKTPPAPRGRGRSVELGCCLFCF